MRIFGKNVFPRQIVVFASGVLFLASTTYDVHRSIKNNQEPPSPEQLQALEDYINASRRQPPDSPAADNVLE
ncbi:hypothetical protein ACJIZ3_023340 [Penstemon smallii]|uniref:Uncharacterized protein n=1 Tax=Penstemon smallii TaxID=265156 RepID=A0ABD3TNU4_9LAMI